MVVLVADNVLSGAIAVAAIVVVVVDGLEYGVVVISSSLY